MQTSIRLSILFSSLLLAVTTFFLAYMPLQSDGLLILGLYGAAFVGYGILISRSKLEDNLFSWLIILGILLRFLLLFSFPNLSNDIYRFLWDGHLLHHGINPLSLTPREFISVTERGSAVFAELFPLLNSQDYYTVYPPISQAVYWVGAYMPSVAEAAIVMKAVLFAAELGSCFLIIKLLEAIEKPKALALWYVLNPLVIVELVGQLHFEAIMICFLLGGIYALVIGRNYLAGFAIAISIATKLLPLMFLPGVLFFLSDKKRILQFMIALVLTLGALFFPMFLGVDYEHFLSSLNLYFQSFEFNASIYYLVRGLGYMLTGYNQIAIIGPALSAVALLVILYQSSKVIASDLKSLLLFMLISLASYLVMTTTVHPWYLCMLVMLCLFSKHWWVVVWSGVVVWSYMTYTTEDYNQNLYLIFIEYLVVLICFIYQSFRYKSLNMGNKKA